MSYGVVSSVVGDAARQELVPALSCIPVPRRDTNVHMPRKSRTRRTQIYFRFAHTTTGGRTAAAEVRTPTSQIPALLRDSPRRISSDAPPGRVTCVPRYARHAGANRPPDTRRFRSGRASRSRSPRHSGGGGAPPTRRRARALIVLHGALQTRGALLCTGVRARSEFQRRTGTFVSGRFAQFHGRRPGEHSESRVAVLPHRRPLRALAGIRMRMVVFAPRCV